jgi:hypothetical protein
MSCAEVTESAVEGLVLACFASHDERAVHAGLEGKAASADMLPMAHSLDVRPVRASAHVPEDRRCIAGWQMLS